MMYNFSNISERILKFLFVLVLSVPEISAQVPAGILKDIKPGTIGGLSNTNFVAELHGFQYFVADEAVYNNRLWRTDGTAQGTTVISSDISDVKELVSAGSQIFFEGRLNNIPGLFATDSTGKNPALVKSFPSMDIFNLHTMPDNKVLFTAEPFSSGSSQLWITDGTDTGSINLGNYNLTEDRVAFSEYLGKTILFDESGFQPPSVITDGTLEGTKLLKDFLVDVANFYDVYGCAGAGDLFFVNGTVEQNGFLNFKAFAVSSSSKKEININGDILKAYKQGDFYFLITDYNVYRYNNANNSIVTLKQEYYSYGPTLLDDGTLYFIANQNQVWRTDGTAPGTQKISIAGIGDSYYDPKLWLLGDTLFYSSIQGGYSIRMVDLSLKTDSLFSTIYPPTALGVYPKLWKFGSKFVFPRSTTDYGFELWVSPPPPVSGIFELSSMSAPLVLSPNPSNGVYWLSDEFQGNEAFIQVFNRNGQMVMSKSTNGNTNIDLSHLLSGSYQVIVQDQNGRLYQGSVIKQ